MRIARGDVARTRWPRAADEAGDRRGAHATFTPDLLVCATGIAALDGRNMVATMQQAPKKKSAPSPRRTGA